MNNVTVFDSSESNQVDVRVQQAIAAIGDGRIPPEMISSHPGKGGKMFRYVKHVHATSVMNKALGNLWDWEVLQPMVFPDGSAMVLGRLTLHLPLRRTEGQEVKFFTRVVQEVGSFDPIGSMPSAMKVSSAASRALLKCMFRAFGFGAELYPDIDDDVTPASAWQTLAKAALKKKIGVEELKNWYIAEGLIRSDVKEKPLTDEERQDLFITNFEKFWNSLGKLIEQKKTSQVTPPGSNIP